MITNKIQKKKTQQRTKHSRQLAAKSSTQKPTQAASMRECDRSRKSKKETIPEKISKILRNLLLNNNQKQNMNFLKFFISLFTFSFFTACGQTTDSKTASDKVITRNLKQDINTILPKGEFVVDIMDEVKTSPRRQELQSKFMKGMKENSEWFLQQRKLVEESGKAMPYDPRIGMTEVEWEEFKIFSTNTNDMEATSSGTAKIIIINKDDVISFKTEGQNKVSFLNSVTIDIKNNTIKVFDYQLTPIDTINVTNPDNVYKSAWRGYKWQFSEKSSNNMPTNQKELLNFSMKLYTVTLGLFDNNKKSYLEVSGSETSGGQRLLRFQIPLVF